jgi:hypothetical protein
MARCPKFGAQPHRGVANKYICTPKHWMFQDNRSIVMAVQVGIMLQVMLPEYRKVWGVKHP